jgi:hypothetical protein
MVPIFSDLDVFMMDEGDYDEHLLLNDLEDADYKHHHHLHPTTLFTNISETSSSGMGDEDLDDVELFDDETEEIVNTASNENMILALTKSHPPSVTPDNKNRTRPVKESEREGCEEPTRVGVPSKFDILCGQSRICAGHTGNRRFQVVLDIYAPRYDASTTKQEKMTLTKEIVNCIHAAGGRFLRYDEGLWEEISDVTARDKVSHALRTKVSSWKRQQKEMGKREESNGVSKSKPSHRRGGRGRSRRSSGSSITTSASDIVTTSFDGNDSSSACVMGELLKAQREIFATLTTPDSTVAVSPSHPLMI